MRWDYMVIHRLDLEAYRAAGWEWAGADPRYWSCWVVRRCA